MEAMIDRAWVPSPTAGSKLLCRAFSTRRLKLEKTREHQAQLLLARLLGKVGVYKERSREQICLAAEGGFLVRGEADVGAGLAGAEGEQEQRRLPRHARGRRVRVATRQRSADVAAAFARNA
eukprot:6198619-Pleurochrysis_carterae.AAC.1